MRRTSILDFQPTLRDLLPVSCVLQSLLASAFVVSAQDTQAPTSTDVTPPSETPAPAPSAVDTTPFSASSNPGYSGLTPSSALTGTSQVPEAPPFVTDRAFEPMGAGLGYGIFRFHPHLSYRVAYGDNLQPSAGHLSNTVINEISPGVLFHIGPHWSLDYTPTIRLYSSRRFRDSVDHSVGLFGGTSYNDWTFGFSQTYVASSLNIVETASQLDQQIFGTGLNATRRLGSHTSLELGASQNFRFLSRLLPGEDVTDTKSWSTMDWIRYQFISGLGASLGAGFGYDDLAIGSDMTSEQLRARLDFTLTQKLSVQASGGAEDRQFLSRGVPDLISPAYSFSIRYRMFTDTTLSADVGRTTTPSLFIDQVTERTTANAGIHQRLLGKLFLDLGFGYGNSSYHATALTPGSRVSNFDSYAFTAGLHTILFRRVSAGLSYALQYNSSQSTFLNYTTTQVALNLGYRF